MTSIKRLNRYVHHYEVEKRGAGFTIIDVEAQTVVFSTLSALKVRKEVKRLEAAMRAHHKLKGEPK